MTACGRILSRWRSRSTHAVIETTRQVVATMVVRWIDVIAQTSRMSFD
jgi:hypothetical protein